MGYRVVIFLKQGGQFLVKGRLSKRKVVEGPGTYYHHPSSARRAIEGWSKLPKLGTWRTEVWNQSGSKVIDVQEFSGGTKT